MKKEDYKDFNVYTDILISINLALEIAWDGIREYSLHRLLYLANVLYSFMFDDDQNPFNDDYDFIPELRGPYSNVINRSLNFLLSNKYLKFDEYNNKYSLGTNPIPEISKTPNYPKREKWIGIVIYILGIYGENKIYDFVFRDPSYLDNVKRLSTKSLDLSPKNKTIEFLKKFKSAFEKTLNVAEDKLDNRSYIELYFRYVFSKIIKGDDSK